MSGWSSNDFFRFWPFLGFSVTSGTTALGGGGLSLFSGDFSADSVDFTLSGLLKFLRLPPDPASFGGGGVSATSSVILDCILGSRWKKRRLVFNNNTLLIV